jgi:hypothetical protein
MTPVYLIIRSRLGLAGPAAVTGSDAMERIRLFRCRGGRARCSALSTVNRATRSASALRRLLISRRAYLREQNPDGLARD